MKVAERIIDIESNVAGEKIDMSIDPTAFAHIMSVLTDLYSDPEQAVIREYSTNARDAQIEAGVERPIEVTLPSPLSPFLSIRDYGIGLDAEGIREVYSQYGASTKRGSNDVVGMLGLGCKSALTYTDQFTVIGRKDGREIQVAIGRDENGAGSMTIVSDHPTDEPNGVTVMVPAKRGSDFAEKAAAFFRFWPEGSVLVNGSPPDRIDGLWLTDRIVVPPQNTLDSHVIVMGGVPYPVADPSGGNRYAYRTTPPPTAGTGQLPVLPDYRFAAIFVDIGEVAFTPSREALQLNKQTKDLIDRVGKDLLDKWYERLQADVARARDKDEAVAKTREARRLGLDPEKCVWNGHVVRLEIQRYAEVTLPDGTKQQRPLSASADNLPFLVGYSSPNASYRKSGDWTGGFALLHGRNGRDDEPLIVFEGWEGAAITPVKRDKVEQFLDKKNGTRGTYPRERWVFVKGKLTAEERRWLPTIYQWADVAAEKLPTSTDGSGKSKKVSGSYWWTKPQRGYHKEQISAADIKPDETVWFQGNYYAAAYSRVVEAGLIPAHFKIICLERNRVEKFNRDFPSIPSVVEYGRRKVQEQMKAIDRTKLQAARYRVEGDDRVKILAPVASEILDPVVREAAGWWANDDRSLKPALDLIQKYRPWLPEGSLPDVNLVPLKHYTLLPRYVSETAMQQHMLLYINAVYTAGKEV